MSLTKNLDKLNDVVTGVLITTIASHVLSNLKPEHKKGKKHAKHHHHHHNACECKKHKCECKKHSCKCNKHNCKCDSHNISCKNVLPLAIGTTAVVKGLKDGNKYNVFSSALFTVIAFKLFVFKQKH